ncbi:BrxE family protein [Desulfobacter sp.]|uniref:BrxE family protein n=1 Tax=Desulfobacter sp. TaxID=2294 RepID=UPI003D0A53E3
MKPDSMQHICETRILVGFLGEKQQASWWGSSFLSSSSKAFLGPIYPNSIGVAQYSGVCQAASIIHDEHIGIGKHYHLYRLPDAIERALFQCIQAHKVINSMSDFLKSRDTAVERLKELGEDTVKESDGPVTVGQYADNKLDALIQISRSHYISAFESDYKTFPYMRCI